MSKSILKRLKSWIASFLPFEKAEVSVDQSSIDIGGEGEADEPVLPDFVGNPERIIRVIFYPDNVLKNESGIRANAFRTPGGIDEVSVIRLDYTDANFCKKHGKEIEDPGRKDYFGFGLLLASEIREFGANVIYSRKEGNPFHSDIKIGFIPEKGVQLPPEFLMKVDKMAKRARLHKDFKPLEISWGGNSELH